MKDAPPIDSLKSEWGIQEPYSRKDYMMAKKSDIEWAWEQAQTVRGKNPNLYRRDELGNPVYKPAFGTEGEMGWEIDHRNPTSKGGSEHRRNLRILQTEANRKKSDDY